MELGNNPGHTVPAAVRAGAEQQGGTVTRAKEGGFELPLQDRRRDAEIHARHGAQGRGKGGKDEQMADADATLAGKSAGIAS